MRTLLVLCCALMLPVHAVLADEARMLADELTSAPGRSEDDKARDAQRKPDQVLAFRDGYYDQALSARLEGDRLPNVERMDAAVSEAGLTPASIDLAFTALNFHDVYNRQGKAGAAEFLASVFDALKPGGTLGLIDHVGNPGADNTSLHRIEPSLVDEVAVEAGFIIEAKSDLLAEPEDDHTRRAFDPTLRGDTDRFILRLRKPE